MSRDMPDLFGKPDVSDELDCSAPSARGTERVSIEMALHDEDVGAAMKLSLFGDRRMTVLLPKSQITVEETGRFNNTGVGSEKLKIVNVSMPQWLAKDRGLV